MDDTVARYEQRRDDATIGEHRRTSSLRGSSCGCPAGAARAARGAGGDGRKTRRVFLAARGWWTPAPFFDPRTAAPLDG
jgi:hypothetical protein